MTTLTELDLKYVWHPFTQMRDFSADEALIITHGRGNYLYDETGARYYDATSSLWVSVHGHNHPVLNARVRHQLGKLDHSTLLGIGNEPSARLAAELADMAPGSLSRVFYSDNGSTAAEVALKMAFQYHRHKGATGRQRSRFVSLANGYHGDTIGSVSVGGMDLFHSIFKPLLFHTYLSPSPNCYRCPFGKEEASCGRECVQAMDDLLAEKGDEVAAVVVEPLVQGAGGQVVYPADVLRGYAEAARRHGVLFVVDEVATGFGRTGTMFACEQAGIVPDLMAVAKGLTGGYLPVAATLVAQHVYDAFLAEWKEFKTFFHGHTYTGNPLGCAAALANLDLVRRPGFLAHIQDVAGHFRRCLDERLGDHPHVGDIRLAGMMGGLELVADRATKAPLPTEARAGHRVCLKAREAGVLARPLSDVVVLMPPLSSTRGEVEHLVEALAWALDAHLLGKGGKPPRRGYAAAAAGGVLGEARAVPRAPGARRLLVTGTDTGVGKTVVTAALAAALAAQGEAVYAYKPVESGLASVAAPGSDAALLAQRSTVDLGLPQAAFLQPISPNIAARQAGQAVDFDAVAQGLRAVDAAQTALLVEGAGGLLVPFTDDFCYADLAREADLAVLIVVADKLGCLNHTLLTVRAAHDLGLPVAGVVLHPLAPEAADESANHNAAELARLLGDLFLGTVPYVPDPHDVSALTAAATPLAATL